MGSDERRHAATSPAGASGPRELDRGPRADGVADPDLWAGLRLELAGALGLLSAALGGAAPGTLVAIALAHLDDHPEDAAAAAPFVRAVAAALPTPTAAPAAADGVGPVAALGRACADALRSTSDVAVATRPEGEVAAVVLAASRAALEAASTATGLPRAGLQELVGLLALRARARATSRG